MSMEDIYTGARSGLLFCTGYMNALVEIAGKEQAHAVNTQVCESLGAAQGGMLKEQAEKAGIQEFDAQTIMSLLKRAIEEGFGIPVALSEASPERAAIKADQCPVYEAGLMMGLDGEEIEARCRSGAIRFTSAMAKQLNPNAIYQLEQFRSGPEGHCIEAVEIE